MDVERVYRILMDELRRQATFAGATWAKLDVMSMAESVVKMAGEERPTHSSSEIGHG